MGEARCLRNATLYKNVLHPVLGITDLAIERVRDTALDFEATIASFCYQKADAYQ